MNDTKKLDKTFLILLIIQIVIIFGMGFFEINQIIKEISFIGILLTMGIWYVLTLNNKKPGK